MEYQLAVIVNSNSHSLRSRQQFILLEDYLSEACDYIKNLSCCPIWNVCWVRSTVVNHY